MSSPDIQPGAVETQQMRVIAPAGVSTGSFARIASPCANMSHYRQTCVCVYGYHSVSVDARSKIRSTLLVSHRVSQEVLHDGVTLRWILFLCLLIVSNVVCTLAGSLLCTRRCGPYTFL